MALYGNVNQAHLGIEPVTDINAENTATSNNAYPLPLKQLVICSSFTKICLKFFLKFIDTIKTTKYPYLRGTLPSAINTLDHSDNDDYSHFT